MGDLPRSPDDTRCPHNGAGVAHAGQIRHTAPTLRLAIPMLPALSATRFVRPPLADDWPLLVTRRRRLHNAAHHVDRGYQKDIPTTDPNRQEAAIRFAHRKPSIHGAHVAEKAGSSRPLRSRCALAAFPSAFVRRA